MNSATIQLKTGLNAFSLYRKIFFKLSAYVCYDFHSRLPACSVWLRRCCCSDVVPHTSNNPHKYRQKTDAFKSSVFCLYFITKIDIFQIL